MAKHAQVTAAPGTIVSFCDPASPWQRAPNENANGLLRQYFRKGHDLSAIEQADVAFAAEEINSRPGAVLGWSSASARFATHGHHERSCCLRSGIFSRSGRLPDRWQTTRVIRTLNLPTTLSTTAQELRLRRASENDLRALMVLLADDPISATRGDKADDSDAAAYRSALTAIVADPSNELLVVVNEADEPVATMQLTRIPGMARRGSTRLLVEAVRVRSDIRSSGIGSAMMQWVTGSAAPAVAASLVQLTSDEARRDAHRFYERLGFVGSHRGFKYKIE